MEISIVTISSLLIGYCSCMFVAQDGIYYNLKSLIPIEVTSLGRVASIGEFYDIRTDQFTHLNLFETAPPNSTLKLTENKNTQLKYTLANTFQEKFKTLDVSAELQLSILGGFIDLKGSGHFFKDTKMSAKSAKASLVQSFATIYEQVSILDAALKPNINFDALSQIDATHVVVGIQWGGNVFISVEDLNQENKDVQIVEGSLDVEMKMMFGLISGKGSVNITDSDKAKISQFSFELYGDVVPEQVPETIFDALEFMKISPKLVVNSNNNKGTAVKYDLLPVDALRKLWNVKTEITTLVRQIDRTTIKNCVKLFDDLQAVQQALNDVVDMAKQYRNYITSTKSEVVNELQDKFDIFYSEVTLNLSQQLVNVRSGSENISILHDILLEATDFKKQWQTNSQKMLSRIKEEIMTLNLLQKQNVTLFDKQTSFSRMLWENQDKDLYILFFNYSINFLYDKSIGDLKKVLDNRNKNQSEDLVFAVNYDLIENDDMIEQWNKTNQICVFHNGKLIFDNYPDGNRPDDPNSEDEIWTIQQIQMEIKQLKRQTVPIGFIYVQYPFQLAPADVWSGTKWQNVSPQYHGTFFRVEGDESSAFETLQNSSYPKHYLEAFKAMVDSNATGNDFCNTGTECDLTHNGWSAFARTGYDTYSYRDIGFKVVKTEGEVRPKNQAIRLWRRIA